MLSGQPFNSSAIESWELVQARFADGTEMLRQQFVGKHAQGERQTKIE